MSICGTKPSTAPTPPTIPSIIRLSSQSAVFIAARGISRITGIPGIHSPKSAGSGSAADKAGLKKGDVVIGLNNDEVTNTAYLKYLLYKYSVGDEIKITYIRDNETKTTKVTLTEAAS